MDNYPSSSNFNLNIYKKLIFDLYNETNNLINQYRLHNYELLTSTPYQNLDQYFNNTVIYGKDTLDHLFSQFFGGEIDYLTNTPYDILLTALLWRYFKVQFDVEWIKIKQKYGQTLELKRTFGFNYLTSNKKETRYFEIISNPIIIENLLNKLNIFIDIGVGFDLYKRFEIFGFIRQYQSITNFPLFCLASINNCLTNKVPLDINLSNYITLTDSFVTDSIHDYITYLYSLNGTTPYKKILINNCLTAYSSGSQKFKLFAIQRYQQFIQFCYYINFPILYRIT